MPAVVAGGGGSDAARAASAPPVTMADRCSGLCPSESAGLELTMAHTASQIPELTPEIEQHKPYD